MSAGIDAKAGDWGRIEAVGKAKGSLLAKTVTGKDGGPGFDLDYEIEPLTIRLKIDVGSKKGVTYTDEWRILALLQF